ncbi:MAG: NAD(P)H-hydrate epimerase, partial [Chthoniobacterales bacterium]
MPILTSAQMRAAEEAAFATGVQVEALMNKAGAGVAQAVTKFFQKPGRCIVFAGKGHNAGDALFAAQCLEQRGWKTEVRLAFKEADFSNLMRKKLGDLLRRPPDVLGAAPSEAANADLVGTFGQFAPDLTEQRTTTQNTIAREACSSIAAPLVILDGLLGVGARPPLREPIRAACRAINQLR